MNNQKYLELILLLVGSLFAFSLVPASAHGPAEDGGGGMMLRMMDLMHGSIDRDSSLKCSGLGDKDLMERGEMMMEELMGHDDHERVEETMEKDITDHDAMHTMMGMWATGCVGDEVAASIGEHYGMRHTAATEEESGSFSSSWLFALAIGVMAGLVVGKFYGKIFTAQS